MKNSNLNLVALAATSLLMYSGEVHAETCTSYLNEQAVLDEMDQDNFMECGVTPDFTRVEVYEIALCEEKPTATDKTSCTVLYQNTTGQILEMTSNSSFPLTDQISVPEGMYPFAYVVISNEFEISIQHQFAFDVYGIDSNNQKEVSGGNFCWTNGSQISALEAGDMTCGPTPAPSVSTERVSVLGLDDQPGDDIPDNNNGVHDPLFFYEGIPSSTLVPFDAYVTDSTGALAVATSALSSVPNGLPPSTNAERIMVVLNLPSATLINEQTTSIDVGFGVTDIGYLLLTGCGSNQVCAHGAGLGGFDLAISAQ
jgi:hypothetical protein